MPGKRLAILFIVCNREKIELLPSLPFHRRTTRCSRAAWRAWSSSSTAHPRRAGLCRTRLLSLGLLLLLLLPNTYIYYLTAINLISDGAAEEGKHLLTVSTEDLCGTLNQLTATLCWLHARPESIKKFYRNYGLKYDNQIGKVVKDNLKLQQLR